MNKAILPGLVVVVAFVAAGAAYLALPDLRSPEDSADTEIRDGVERARRLLAKVRENQERLDVVLEGLRIAGIAPLDSEEIPDLVEADRELLVDAEDHLQEIARAVRTRRQGLTGEYPAAETLPPPLLSERFGGNAPQMTQAIRQGLADRDRLLRENEQLLDEALQSLRQAMSVRAGDIAGSNDPAALRLYGAVLYAQGTALHRRAAQTRDRAAGSRADLAIVAAQLARRASEQSVVADSGIEAKIAAARDQHRATAAALEELRSQRDSLRDQAADLESRLAEQKAVTAAARDSLDALAVEDLDATDFQTFAQRYAEQSKVYREALGQAQVLEFGTLANAAIDSTGDLIKGDYVPADESSPVTPQWGLVHFQDQLAVAETQVAEMERALAALEGDIASMEETRATLAHRQEASAAEAEILRTRVAEAYDAMSESLAEAEATEDEAIGKLEEATGKFNQAATAMKARQSEAREAAAELGPEAARRSPDTLLAEDRWLPASSEARAADAQLRLAMIYYERYRDVTLVNGVLANLGDALPEDADRDALAEQAEVARGAGLEAAASAVDALFDASRDMKQQFALTAEIAAAYYLQSLFDGDPLLVRAAIRNYEAAVEGRTDSPYVAEYKERLEQLRRAQASSRKAENPVSSE